MIRRTPGFFALSATLAAALAPGAATADLLITKDGATIETDGPWRVDGRRVLFMLPNGQLSSLRTDELDLDRSALETARAAEVVEQRAELAAAPVGEPILRLGEDDLPKEEGSEAAEEEKRAAEAEAPKTPPLEIVTFEKMPLDGDEGVQVFGTVRNNGKDTLTSVSITAILYGEEGGMLANGEAQLNKTAIRPGDTASFRVEFPGLPDFASVKFETAARGFGNAVPGEEGEDGELTDEDIEAQVERAAVREESERASGATPDQPTDLGTDAPEDEAGDEEDEGVETTTDDAATEPPPAA